MNELTIQNLVKAYGDNLVVNNVSFTVDEGEFFVLLGPSGGGKSTLLRLLCGLEVPDAGKIILAGRDITRLPSRERNIGMVFQDYGLYPHMNAYQNIAYGLEARGVPRNEVNRRVQAAAARLGISDLLERVIVDLSGGEQQRVALARAMAKDADLFLFDEPLSNLDPKLRSQARRDIQMLHREKNRPSIYVTHDQTEALAIGDRIGIIAKGKLQQVGTAEELISQPANLYVAGFIGSPPMNLVRGKLGITENQQYEVKMEGFTLCLPDQWNSILDRFGGEDIVLGIRPSAFILPGRTDPGASQGENILNSIIEDIEPLIGEIVVRVRVGEHSLACVFQEVDENLRPGSDLMIAVNLQEISLFDPVSEEALVH